MSIDKIKAQLEKKAIVVDDEIIYAIMDAIYEINEQELYEATVKDGADIELTTENLNGRSGRK